MNLTKKDKEILLEMGYPEEDFPQIERAATKTIYTTPIKEYGEKKQRISAKQANEILGREEFLSGLGRSAFHWSALRENENGEKVYFDSSKLFKD